MKEAYQSKISQYIEHDNDLKEILNENQQTYKKVSQLAYYANLSNIEQLRVFSKSTADVELNVFFTFRGNRYNPQMREQIQCFLIRTLDEQIPNLKNQYSLVYVCHQCSDFLFFKSLLQRLPAHYYTKIKNIYMIGLSILAKIYQILSFGTINRFIQGLIVYGNTIQQIQAANKVSIRQTISHNNNAHNQVRKSGKSENGVHQVKIIKNQIYGKNLQEYEINSLGIPILIDKLLRQFLKHQQYQRAQGIFRKNCDIELLQQFEHQLINKNYLSIQKIKDPYVIVGCLKKIFNNLNQPLFHYDIYSLILKYRSDGQTDDLQFVKNILQLLKPIHKKVLLIMVVMLIKKIILNQPYNKMSAYNLSVVFGPCFFRPKEYKLDDLINSGKFAKIILILLTKLQNVLGEQTVFQYYQLLQKIQN